MPNTATTTATLVKKTQVTADVFDLVFRTTDPFHFQAGQFASIRFPADKPPFFRPYSIASRPSDDGHHLQFCIKKIPGGPASTYICELEEGAVVDIKGPQGHFVADQTEVDRYYFITTGTGIAPLKSMFEDLLITKRITTPVFLVFGFRSEADRFYLDSCEALKNQFLNFDYTVTLSQPDPTWPGHHGRVTHYLTNHLTHHAPGTHYYLCGIGDMIKDIRTYLEQIGAPKDNVHYERFT